MWNKDSIHLLRQDEISAFDSINGYLSDDKMDGHRSIQVRSTMLNVDDKKPIPIMSMVAVVLVDVMRPKITQWSDLTKDERLVVAAQIEAAIDNIDFEVDLDDLRLALLSNSKRLSFAHEIVDNDLFHTGISVVPNYIN